MVKEFVIILGDKEVFTSDSLAAAQSEYAKNKYLLGFNTVRTALKEDTEDKRIATYIEETDSSELNMKKLTKVLIERVHNNKAKRLRSQLIYRFNLPEGAESSGSQE